MGHPLILTLQIDRASQAFYEDLRRRYFPPECNLIPAHLTLFHQLPDDERTYQTLREAAQSTPIFTLIHPNLRSIGRGVAVFFESECLISLHAGLSSVFEVRLNSQDRQRFRPHIVVQNKVDPGVARLTLAQLRSHTFVEPRVIGLTLWRYLGGPWHRLLDLPFTSEHPA